MQFKYLIPNSFTTINLLLGVLSIFNILNIQQDDITGIIKSLWIIVIAGFFDGFDGKLARMTNTQSKFGVEYDSLADLVTFVLAPAFIVYKIIPQNNLFFMSTVLIYIVAGALRLARFNVVQGSEKKKGKFLGLPTPGASGTIIGYMLFYIYWKDCNINYSFFITTLSVITMVSGFLMISNIYYDNVYTMFKVESRLFKIGKFSIPFIVFLGLLIFLLLTNRLYYFFFPLSVYYHLRAFYNMIKEKERANQYV